MDLEKNKQRLKEIKTEIYKNINGHPEKYKQIERNVNKNSNRDIGRKKNNQREI